MSLFVAGRLIPFNFVTEVLYPPRDLPHSLLMNLFQELAGVYNYLNLKLLTEDRGAIFTGEKGSRCEILKDKVIVHEEMNVISFENYTESVVDILQRVWQKIAPQVFIGQLNIVRMLYPLPSEQAANQFLMRSFLQVPQGLGQQLGRPLAGIGLRLVFPPTPEVPNEYQLRIEPFFRDQTQLFLENAGRFFPPFKETSEARARLKATYEFLKSSLEALL